MSEVFAAANALQTPVQSTQEAHRFNWRMAIAVAGLSGLALTACASKGGETPAAASSSAASSAAASGEAQACGVDLDLSANLANSQFGTPESEFPALQQNVSGNAQPELITTDNAKNTVKKQIANDARVAATIYAFVYEPRQNLQIPTSATLPRVTQIEDQMVSNPTFANNVAEADCTLVDFLTPTTAFAVTKGQAKVIVTNRDANNNIIKLSDVDYGATALLQGFEFGFNADDTSLTEEQKALYTKLQSLLLINGDGRIVLNELDGPNTSTIAPSVTTAELSSAGPSVSATATPSQEQSQSSSSTTSNSSKSNSNSNSQTNNGGTTGQGSSGGVAVGQQGCGTSGKANCGGGAGTGTGNEGSTGTGTGGSTGGGEATPTAPATQPGTTPTAPEATPTPTPTPTEGTPQPTPTPTGNKGSEPVCVPNPPYVICPTSN